MRSLIVIGALLAGTPWIVQGAGSIVEERLPAPLAEWWAGDEPVESSSASDTEVAHAQLEWAPAPERSDEPRVPVEEPDPFPLPYRAAVILVCSGIVPVLFRRPIGRALERQSNAVNAGLLFALAVPPVIAAVLVTGGTGFVASSVVCAVGIAAVAASYLWLSALDASRTKS